jgi:hypothetical protein
MGVLAMGQSGAPTSDGLKSEFPGDMERLLGVDDASLKRNQPKPRPPLSDAERETQKQSATEALKAWARTLLLAVTGGRPLTGLGPGQALVIALVIASIVVFVSVFVFTAIDRLGVRFDDGPSAPNATRQSAAAPQPGGGGAPGATAEATPGKRWLIVASLNDQPWRPQFTIELQGDGPSGNAIWLEPPQATGTYSWEGDNLKVKLALPAKSITKGTWNRRFNLEMVRQTDGTLKGTLFSENFLDDHKGLHLRGFDEWKAIGQPK